MVKIDALLTKSLTFLRFILNLPPPPLPENLEIYTHARTIVTIIGSPEAIIKAKELIFKKIGKIGITNFDVSESNRTDTTEEEAILAKHDELVSRLKKLQKKSSKSGNSSVSCSSSFNETCSLHHQKMSSFCIQDSLVVCHKCLLYGDHKFHESLDLEIEENR